MSVLIVGDIAIMYDLPSASIAKLGEGAKPGNTTDRRLLTLAWQDIILISMIDMIWLLRSYPFPSFLEASP